MHQTQTEKNRPGRVKINNGETKIRPKFSDMLIENLKKSDKIIGCKLTGSGFKWFLASNGSGTELLRIIIVLHR